MKLSKNFTLDELTATSKSGLQALNTEKAVRDPEILDNLTKLANEVLQVIRDYYGKAVVVSSGYRCLELNAAVGGSQTSQHSYGEAADIQIAGVKADQIFEDIKNGKIAGLKSLGQVILEKVGGKEWVHISIMTDRYRKIQEARYGTGDVVYLTTNNGRTYERVV